MKRLAFVIALAVLLSSCGIIIINRPDSDSTEGTAAPPVTFPDTTADISTEPVIIDEPDYESQAAERLSSLPEITFDGYSVFITVNEESNLFFDEEEEAVYRSFILRRNYNLVEKYDFKPIITYETSARMRSEMVKAKKTGDHYTDLAVIPQTDFGTFATGKVLRNLKTLPYTDFDSECFEQSSVECFTFGGSLYGITGSAVTAPDIYPCLYARADLEWTDIGALAKKIASGDTVFTLDSLNELLRQGTLSSSAENSELSLDLFLSFGAGFYDGTNVGLSSNAGTVVSYVRNVVKNIKTSVTSSDGEENAVSYTGADIFARGLSDFAFGTLADMRGIGTCGFRWEILPVPAVSENSGYTACTLSSCPVIIASDTSESVDVPGFILQALNEASYKCFYGEYVRSAVLYYITSSTAIDMAEIICGQSVHDKGLVSASASKYIKAVTTDALSTALGGSGIPQFTEKELKNAQNAFKNIK